MGQAGQAAKAKTTGRQQVHWAQHAEARTHPQIVGQAVHGGCKEWMQHCVLVQRQSAGKSACHGQSSVFKGGLQGSPQCCPQNVADLSDQLSDGEPTTCATLSSLFPIPKRKTFWV
eukprot:1153931-Pelagomonas_calceolata.AAC.10